MGLRIKQTGGRNREMEKRMRLLSRVEESTGVSRDKRIEGRGREPGEGRIWEG